jgi:hypothetical protein
MKSHGWSIAILVCALANCEASTDRDAPVDAAGAKDASDVQDSGDARSGASGSDASDEATQGDGAAGEAQTLDAAALCSRPVGCLPAPVDLLTGDSTGFFGRLPLAGEFMEAVFESKAMNFSSRFLMGLDGFTLDAEPWDPWPDNMSGTAKIMGVGLDGRLHIVLPSFEVGQYKCPEASLGYFNLDAGSHETNFFVSDDCCVIDVEKSGGAGEPVTGTFSGLLIRYSGGNSCSYNILATQGKFSVRLQ